MPPQIDLSTSQPTEVSFIYSCVSMQVATEQLLCANLDLKIEMHSFGRRILPIALLVPWAVAPRQGKHHGWEARESSGLLGETHGL